MAGCFGSDIEDKHFENQMINETDVDSSEKSYYTELDDEVVSYIMEFIDNNSCESDPINITFRELILPMLQTLNRHEVGDNNTLAMHMLELEATQTKKDELKILRDELLHTIGDITKVIED